MRKWMLLGAVLFMSACGPVTMEERASLGGTEQAVGLVDLRDCCGAWKNCDGEWGAKKCSACGGQQVNGICVGSSASK